VRKAIRVAAWTMVAAGIAAPLLRKRAPAPPLVTQAVAFGAPLGLAVALPRSRRRDLAICALQMWAYVAAYKTPHDDEAEQEGRVHIDYPIAIDRALGLGELPSRRLQRWLSRSDRDGPRWHTLDRVLAWAHWSWFMVPHGAVLYVMWRRPERFARAATLTYAVFDTGSVFYWVAPTAPPWYAASRRAGASGVRRMMVEYGEDFWGEGWDSLYSVFGGNPLAAMPSLHFATSLMATWLLADVDPLAGAAAGAYTATLGLSLVYLGEHYVIDLIAGAALAAAVRRSEPRLAQTVAGIGRAVANVGRYAHGAG